MVSHRFLAIINSVVGLARRALVVEDDGLMASLIATAIERANFSVSTAGSVAEALDLIPKFDPDVALIDISLGDGPTGIDLARTLRATRPEIGILILTKHPDSRTAGLSDQIPEGVGFLRKETVGNLALLLESIEMVLSDNSTRVRQDKDPARPFAALSARQIEILRMVAQGLTNNEIASRLGNTNSAVEKRLALIFRNLGIEALDGVSPRAEAMRIFIAHAGLPERD